MLQSVTSNAFFDVSRNGFALIIYNFHFYVGQHFFAHYMLWAYFLHLLFFTAHSATFIADFFHFISPTSFPSSCSACLFRRLPNLGDWPRMLSYPAARDQLHIPCGPSCCIRGETSASTRKSEGRGKRSFALKNEDCFYFPSYILGRRWWLAFALSSKSDGAGLVQLTSVTIAAAFLK